MIKRITNHESCLPAGRARITRKAFTLIELLIAIVLIVSGLIALMHVMSIGIFADSNLEYRLTALNLVNEKLEEIKNAGYSLASSETESSITGFSFIDNRTTTAGFVDANLNSTTADTGLKDVTVQVQWTQKGSQDSVGEETLIADY